jgi:hypothetical protein
MSNFKDGEELGKFEPEKLTVEFRDGVNAVEPIIPRRYTLTHSDETAELFLTIGLNYAYDKTNTMKDEVLSEWVKADNRYLLKVFLKIDGIFRPGAAAVRNEVFRRELPMALEAIIYGDRAFFNAHRDFYEVPIIVHFNSSIPMYYKVENW